MSIKDYNMNNMNNFLFYLVIYNIIYFVIFFTNIYIMNFI